MPSTTAPRTKSQASIGKFAVSLGVTYDDAVAIARVAGWAVEADPDPVADFFAALADDGDLEVEISPTCAADFGGGTLSAFDMLADFDICADRENLIGVDANGRSWVIEW